jgi:hypothetical protein
VLHFFLALALIVVLLLGCAGAIHLVVSPASALWRARGRLRESTVVRQASADLDREYASLVDEYRDLTT